MNRLTTARIRRDINSRPTNEPFTTREMLIHGRRKAVDQCLWKMVNTGVIRRLARGVFVKAACRRTFELFEIAKIKALAFGKKILRPPEHPELRGLRIAERQDPNTFYVDGYSSSFGCGKQRIYLKGTVARKFALGQSMVGVILRELWISGLDECTQTPDLLDESLRRFAGSARDKLRRLVPLLPEWLHELVLEQAFPARRDLVSHSMYAALPGG